MGKRGKTTRGSQTDRVKVAILVDGSTQTDPTDAVVAPGADAVAIAANEPSAPSAAPIKSNSMARDPYDIRSYSESLQDQILLTIQQHNEDRQCNKVVASTKKLGVKG